MPGTLVIRLKGMGDIVHVIPSLALFRAQRPGEPLVLLCQKPFGDIVPPSLGVEVWQMPPRAGFWETLRWIAAIRHRHFDRIVDLFGNPRTALLSLLSGVPWRAGFAYRIRSAAYHHTYVPPDPNCHLMQLFRAFFAHFSLIEGPVSPPVLEPSPSALTWAKEWREEQFGKHFLFGFNLHTTYPSKAWPHEHFVTFITRWFQETGHPVLLFWGPGEREATEQALARLPAGAARIHPALSLDQLLALLTQLHLFLTADTGPMNLAWALQVPTVALFGPTTRKAVAPQGAQHLSLHHPTLFCLQCHKERCDQWLCLPEMTPDWVFAQIRQKYFPKGFPA